MTSVLIVEDDPILALDLEMSVADAGGRVVGTFATAADAIAFAKQAPPELALVDLNLADGATGGGVAAALDELGCKDVVLSGGDRMNPHLYSTRHTFISKPAPVHLLEELIRGCRKEPAPA